MPAPPRPKLTYANVMVTVLAVIVLGGGTAYAATQLSPNSVGSRQLKPQAVTPPKLADESVRSRALSRPLQNAFSSVPSVARIHFAQDAAPGATPQRIGTIGSLTLKAACVSDAGTTSIVFAVESPDGGRVQENFQNDSGADPGQPGGIQAGNLQFSLPAGSNVIGGPPGVSDGTFFRTIASLVFTTGQETDTLHIASLADGTAGHCSVDGTGLSATG